MDVDFGRDRRTNIMSSSGSFQNPFNDDETGHYSQVTSEDLRREK